MDAPNTLSFEKLQREFMARSSVQTADSAATLNYGSTSSHSQKKQPLAQMPYDTPLQMP